MTTSKSAVAVLIGAAAILSACGAEQPDVAQPATSTASADPTTTTTTVKKPREEQRVVKVINRFHRAVDSANGKKACALLTDTLRGVYATNPGASDCPDGVEYTNKQLGSTKMSALKVAAADVKVRGKEAVVSHRRIAKRNGTDAETTDSYHLVRASGDWRIDYVG